MVRPNISFLRPEDLPTYLQLLALFREGRRLTQSEITEHLPIDSTRQVRRLIKKLRERDIPLEDAYQDGKKEYKLPAHDWASEINLSLTEQEVLALILVSAAAASGVGPAPLEDALQGAVESLLQRLPGSVDTFEPAMLLDHLHFGEAASVEVDSEVFMDLLDALHNRRALEIDYYSASSDRYDEGRRIDPLGLAVRGDAWLCVAHDHKSGERRDFNLTRIDTVRSHRPESNGGDYTIPDEFDLESHFVDRFESLDADEVYEVHLRVNPEVVSYFESKAYHRTQCIHQDDDGEEGLVVSYEVAGLEEIASFVRSWGAAVRVLHPPELATRIAEEARAMVAQYESGDAVS